MKCHYCKQKEGALSWHIFQVCQDCYDKLMKRRLEGKLTEEKKK